MNYPINNKNKKTIGITSMSAGQGKYIDKYELSINNIKKYGFNIIETPNVRNEENPSSDKVTRVKELNSLVTNQDVDIIMCASGGDFLYDMIPHVNFENIENNPKLFVGASDPASLLYLITTNLDIATIYGFNAASFDQEKLHVSEENCLEILRGNIVEQNSFEKYEIDKEKRTDTYNLTEKVEWETLNGEVDITGRIIGGCIDCLRLIPGTRFDNTKNFIEKYKEDGIIWYFDIFSLTAEDLYLTLIQLRESGWFKYIKGVVVGRVKYPNSFVNITYQEVLKKIFKDIPLIFNADIGHVVPKMTIINGSIAHIISNNGTGKIELRME